MIWGQAIDALGWSGKTDWAFKGEVPKIISTAEHCMSALTAVLMPSRTKGRVSVYFVGSLCAVRAA